MVTCARRKPGTLALDVDAVSKGKGQPKGEGKSKGKGKSERAKRARRIRNPTASVLFAARLDILPKIVITEFVQ